jgi:hypothetical protein
VRIVPDLQVQVGGATLHRNFQQIIYLHADGFPKPSV